ncbi:hypothetical protein CDO52_11560 [Nocardiopsis gilva YIM 90087]|uniref:DUF308 domain-containing protein n=1 Tax=Nocardiopsis gilva YIM 90087 TaxID=1235441 RepID=A0A223S5B4_9ACTN|nr:hypothetical protein [Nocardiopsis gilva]ASU83330.1 hypothetical protein CDO52_11560 [Nocardiopsis gilva YIM 90087]
MTQRRGNGLLADTYVPLILLPPATADRMLDALRRSGIAAYALPLDDEVQATAAIAVEDPPTDHLYVDAEEREAAAAILRRELPELGERALGGGAAETAAEAAGAQPRAPDTPGAETADDPETDTPASSSESARSDPGAADSTASPASSPSSSDADDADVWADLVARFYESGGPPAGDIHWPDAENLSVREPADRPDDTADRPSGDGDPSGIGDGPVAEGVDSDGGGAGRRYGRGDDSDPTDHYVPPPPPPFPRGDLTSRLSWGGLFGGPLLLLGSMLLGIRLPGWLAFCAVAAFIAGFVVLVVRMSDRPSGGNGPDDGAVV